jgi:hypothetical protein
MPRHDYHQDLEVELLARHVSDVHVVGKIDGMLAVLADLNNYVNHAPTFGFVEIDVRGGLERALAAMFPDAGPTLAPAGEWASAAREALTRVAISEGAAEVWSDHIRRPLARVVDEIVYLLGVLLVGEAPVQAWHVERSPGAGGGAGVYGYLSDATLVFAAGDRAWLLGLGWSD